jgi:hypothetical protein
MQSVVRKEPFNFTETSLRYRKILEEHPIGGPILRPPVPEAKV